MPIYVSHVGTCPPLASPNQALGSQAGNIAGIEGNSFSTVNTRPGHMLGQQATISPPQSYSQGVRPVRFPQSCCPD